MLKRYFLEFDRILNTPKGVGKIEKGGGGWANNLLIRRCDEGRSVKRSRYDMKRHYGMMIWTHESIGLGLYGKTCCCETRMGGINLENGMAY